jgi:hypothetical protein
MPRRLLGMVEAKRKNIEFLYNSAAKPRVNPEEKARRPSKVHILDSLLGRWE